MFIEPSMSNRFIIKTFGVDIPSYLFRRYKLYNDGEQFILETDFYETMNFTFNPEDIFNMTGIQIEYVDPTNTPFSSLKFDITGINYEKKGDYADSDLTFNNLVLKVKRSKE